MIVDNQHYHACSSACYRSLVASDALSVLHGISFISQLAFQTVPHVSPSHPGLTTQDINKTLLIILINYDVSCSYN